MALNPKQQAFVREYLVDFNATQAAIRAGYSPKTAGVQGHELLKKPEISEEVDRGRARLASKAAITAEEVINGLKREAQAADNDGARVAAWSWLGKHLKLFTEKQELAGADGAPLQIAININRGKK